MGDNKKWTKRDVRAILINPIYAGIPPFPPAWSDEEWITAQQNRIESGEDLQKYFTEMLFYLRQSFAGVKAQVPPSIDPACINDAEWVGTQLVAVKKNTRQAMATLLQELRASPSAGPVSQANLPSVARGKDRRHRERRSSQRRKR